MCLILVAHGVRDDAPLVFAANRDEFLDRPTLPASFWDGKGGILAGRDLTAGGTWLGVTRTGRLAAVTNIREPSRHRPQARSRGDIPTGFLRGHASPEAYFRSLAGYEHEYNGYNALAYARGRLWYGSNRDPDGPRGLERGVHGLSNSILDDPWPKVRSGTADLAHALEADDLSIDALFEILTSDRAAPDDELPDTGVGLERERALSSRFIRYPGYGTRSSTVVILTADDHVTFVERTWSANGGLPETRAFRFPVDATKYDELHVD